MMIKYLAIFLLNAKQFHEIINKIVSVFSSPIKIA